VFDISPEKLLVLAGLAFVVLGPDRLPAAARTLGRLGAELRRLSSLVPPEARAALHDPRRAVAQVLAEPRQMISDTLTPLNPLTAHHPPTPASPVTPLSPPAASPPLAVPDDIAAN
jgi:sec-independent protein translocase protein TatB